MQWIFRKQETDDLHGDPGFLRRVFGDTSYAPIWLAVRVYVGWVWINSGWGLLQNAAWMRDGTALRLAWERDPSTTGATDYSLHSSATQLLIDTGAVEWIARLTSVGMTLVGIALILGIASGIASFLGVILSANVMIAGSMVADPLILGLAMVIVLAWKTAGWIGLDRWVLPLVGAPWKSRSVLAPAGRQPEVSLKATR